MKLEVRELTKQYPHKTALDHVSFTLEEGVYGLLGPNGAGKTTLVTMVAGILRPTGGSVLWDGQDTDALGPRYREVLGFQPQTPSLYASFRADEFLRYMAAVKGLKLTRKELDRRVAELLEQVNLSQGRPPADRGVLRGDAAAAGHRPGPAGGPQAADSGRAHRRAGPQRAGAAGATSSPRWPCGKSSSGPPTSSRTSSSSPGTSCCSKRGNCWRKETPQQLVKGMEGKVFQLPVQPQEVPGVASESPGGQRAAPGGGRAAAHRGGHLPRRPAGPARPGGRVPVLLPGGLGKGRGGWVSCVGTS